MTKEFKYVGPHDAVDVAGLGVVERGGLVHVDGDQADEFQARDDWQHVPDRARSRAAKKAAAKKAAEPAPAEPAPVDNTGDAGQEG